MNTPVNIEALHTAITSAIATQFPALKSCDAYPRPGEKIATPAIFIELDQIQSEPDNGTEQLPVVLAFSAYVVRSYKGSNKLAVRSLTASLMAFLRGQRFGQPIGPIVTGDAVPDMFDPQDNGGDNAYECMRLPFEMSAILGTDAWIDDGPVPDTIDVAQAPTVGEGGDYETIVQP